MTGHNARLRQHEADERAGQGEVLQRSGRAETGFPAKMFAAGGDARRAGRELSAHAGDDAGIDDRFIGHFVAAQMFTKSLP